MWCMYKTIYSKTVYETNTFFFHSESKEVYASVYKIVQKLMCRSTVSIKVIVELLSLPTPHHNSNSSFSFYYPARNSHQSSDYLTIIIITLSSSNFNMVCSVILDTIFNLKCSVELHVYDY